MFSLMCAWINDWVNNGEAGDLRRHRSHYDVTVMKEANTSCAENSNNNDNDNDISMSKNHIK